MKQLFTFVLAAMAFVACTQNEVEELTANRADVPETLTVGFEGGDTRIELNEALKTVWTEGDEVSVFYRSNINQRWQYQGETGERIGDLRRVDAGSGTPSETTKVVIAYPYDEAYYLNSESCNLQAMLPAVQSYKAGSYGEGGNILVSQSEYNQFSLKSVCGWLRVELTGNGHKVESITLRGNAGEQVAGELYIDTATAEATLASERGEAGEGAGGSLIFDDTMFTEVTLDCGEGVELGSEATEFYIALPPQTFAEGMTIEVNCAGYKPMTLSTESSITIERNHIVPMEAVEYDAEYKVPANQIWYTTTNGEIIDFNSLDSESDIISNEYVNDQGIITFDYPIEYLYIGSFANYETLQTLTISNHIEGISETFCSGCPNLTQIDSKYSSADKRSVIVDNVLICVAPYGIKEYNIPYGVKKIGYGATNNCQNVEKITIPDSVTEIGECAFFFFEGNPNLKSIELGNSVEIIGAEAFYGCTGLTEINIPNSVTTIGDEAFSYCSSLTSFTIPDNVTDVGEGIFTFCNSLAAFNGNDATDGGRCWVKDNTIIAYAAASGNTYTIPDNITKIGDGAFSGCYNLTSVTIPDSVTTIGEDAFYYCSSLSSVYCEATTPPTLGGYVFYGNGKIYVPAESVDLYKKSEYWSNYAYAIYAYDFEKEEEVIPENVSKLYYTSANGETVTPRSSSFDAAITSNTYENDQGIITFNGELTIIGDRAFEDCINLTSVTIPDSVITIGDLAFEDCTRLTSIYITDIAVWCSITFTKFYTNPLYNGCDLFLNGELVTDLLIPDSVTTIGEYAFSYCDSLTSVTIPDSVTTIGHYAFYNCGNLTSVTIPDSVTTIGNYAFQNCSNLTSVYCKATTPPTLGGSYVFDANVAGRKIYLPAASVNDYKSAENWSGYAADIVGYNFETGEVVE